MLTDELAVREYLHSAEDVFWEWHDAGDVVVWRHNGKTIAFRGELADSLSGLETHGLPPLSAIVLLLAATRQSWSSTGSEAEHLVGMLEQASAGSDRIKLLHEVLAGLQCVRALDDELRTPAGAKRALVELVFEGVRTEVGSDTAKGVVAELRHGIAELLARPEPDVATRGYGAALLLRDLGPLRDGLRRVDAGALRLRLATGLASLPAPAEIVIPPATTAFNLIGALTDDNELAGLGRVARRLLSSASLPRRLSAEPEQELGGYADISNRGSLDRLLASELAHDNLTLAVRVAMNEALYLRRESPPSKPQQHRAVLIDGGIRSWGVPRVFATAASLAFAATLSKRGSISFARARGDELDQVDLLTREGVVKHLEALSPDLHLADALPAFLGGLVGAETPVEPVLVMTEDGLADPAVQEALRRAAFSQLFIATVSRQGRFRMYERRLHGSKLLHEATLDLSELLADGPTLIKPTADADMPAIFSIEPFPLYLSHSVQHERTWHIERWGAMSVTNDRRLMLWAGKQRGARQLTDRLPSGKVWWSSDVDDEDCLNMVIGHPEKLELVRIDRDGRRLESLPLHCGPASSVCGHGGVLFVIHRRSITVLSMQSGATMERLAPPAAAHWRCHRFFGDHNGAWYALSHDGRAARFETVRPGLDAARAPRLITMFDLDGADGPMAVTEAGYLYDTAKGTVRPLQHNLTGAVRVPWVSPDGRRLQLVQVNPVKYYHPSALVDVVHGRTTPSGSAICLDDRVQKMIAPTTLRHRFSAVGVTDFGYLGLQSHRGQVLCFQVSNGLPLFTVADRSAKLRNVRRFEPLENRDVGYKLSIGRWDDGSQCVLDARGLLHLRAARRTIPEATLVLAEGELSGWSSDGRAWGKMYYVSAGPHVLDSALAQVGAFEATVQRFVACIDA